MSGRGIEGRDDGVDTGRERAIALTTAAVNARFGDGDTALTERALSDGLALTYAEDTMRELSNIATVLVGEAARDANVEPCEWWSAIATQLAIDGVDAEPPLVTLVTRMVYSFAAASSLADKFPDGYPLREGERDLLLSQVNEALDALRRLRRRVA
jgi:hypothetical protein